MEVPGFFMGGGYFGAGAGDLSPEKRLGEQKSLEHFTVDDLLDFPNDDALMADGFLNNVANSTDSSVITPVDSCNSSVSGGDNHFSGNMTHFSSELCVPYEDMAELEWLSNFVEDSFSTEEDLRSLHLVTGAKPPTPESSCSETRPDPAIRNTNFPTETPLPVKARSKRSRAAPCDWSTRLLHLASDPKQPPPLDKAANHAAPSRKRDVSGANSDSSGRKCLHCATEKTPQWRTGPMGPKTLCNACGVRYKSGRLVAEYRPAASPTFMSTRHSNSHRKVLELRRQKEMQRAQHHQQFLSQTSIFGGADEYLIHHHNGPDYRHMI